MWLKIGGGQTLQNSGPKKSIDVQAPQARGRGSGHGGRRGRRLAVKHSIILQAYVYAGAAAN